ncbi:MAG: GATA-binding factor [Akkermansiaceae bacterium]|nr:GATA-binding factor [Akkermansiaceae bacterium]
MQVCKNCGTDCTPFWRKDKNDQLPLCNACGLYAAKNGSMRPASLWRQEEGASQLPRPPADDVEMDVRPQGTFPASAPLPHLRRCYVYSPH